MRRRGLLFIELLILFLILMIITIILLLIMSNARARGYKTQCISNLRQIGMALEIYSQSYDGLLPLWLNRRHDSSGVASKWDNPENLYRALRSRIKNDQVLFCPTDPYAGKDEDRFLVNHRRSSYFFNLRPPSTGGAHLRITGLFIAGRLHTVPADYPLVRDANTGFIEPREPRPSKGCEHLGGVNVLYLDGHVEWKRDLDAERELEIS